LLGHGAKFLNERNLAFCGRNLISLGGLDVHRVRDSATYDCLVEPMEPAKTLADIRGLLAAAWHGRRSTGLSEDRNRGVIAGIVTSLTALTVLSEFCRRSRRDRCSCEVVCRGWSYLAIQLAGPSFVLPTD
jgi:hypothetical protein